MKPTIDGILSTPQGTHRQKQQDADADKDKASLNQNLSLCCLLALKLTTVGEEICLGQVDLFVNLLLHFSNEVAKVSPPFVTADVALDDDTPRDVLAVDSIRSVAKTDIGDLF